MSKRTITTAIALVVGVLIVVAMALWGTSAVLAPFPSAKKATSKASCTPELRDFIFRRDITVSVFNAGGRQGLAAEAMSRLEERNFKVGDTSNAPGDVKVKRVQVWTTKEDDPAAKLVAANIGPRVEVKVTKRDLGRGVDVVVGPRWEHLAPGGPARMRLDKPLQQCN